MSGELVKGIKKEIRLLEKLLKLWSNVTVEELASELKKLSNCGVNLKKSLPHLRLDDKLNRSLNLQLFHGLVIHGACCSQIVQNISLFEEALKTVTVGDCARVCVLERFYHRFHYTNLLDKNFPKIEVDIRNIPTIQEVQGFWKFDDIDKARKIEGFEHIPNERFEAVQKLKKFKQQRSQILKLRQMLKYVIASVESMSPEFFEDILSSFHLLEEGTGVLLRLLSDPEVDFFPRQSMLSNLPGQFYSDAMKGSMVSCPVSLLPKRLSMKDKIHDAGYLNAFSVIHGARTSIKEGEGKGEDFYSVESRVSEQFEALKSKIAAKVDELYGFDEFGFINWIYEQRLRRKHPHDPQSRVPCLTPIALPFPLPNAAEVNSRQSSTTEIPRITFMEFIALIFTEVPCNIRALRSQSETSVEDKSLSMLKSAELRKLLKFFGLRFSPSLYSRNKLQHAAKVVSAAAEAEICLLTKRFRADLDTRGITETRCETIRLIPMSYSTKEQALGTIGTIREEIGVSTDSTHLVLNTRFIQWRIEAVVAFYKEHEENAEIVNHAAQEPPVQEHEEDVPPQLQAVDPNLQRSNSQSIASIISDHPPAAQFEQLVMQPAISQPQNDQGTPAPHAQL